MYAQLLKLVQDTRTSFWFVPSCMTLGAIVLASLMLLVDTSVEPMRGESSAWFSHWQPDGAKSILSMIAGSILGVAGVTFSITIVAVSFAGANYGPRLINNFMSDRGNQFTLGTFIATFAYSLMTLQSVREASASGAQPVISEFVPYWTISLALMLTLASLMVLIYFIHHVPETINIDNIAADIGRRLRDDVTDLFPDPDAIEDEDAHGLWDAMDGLQHTSIASSRTGYVQTLDEEQLAQIALDNDLLIRVQYRPGDFIIDSNVALDAWSEALPDKDTIEAIRNCFAVGQQRTANQNILFSTDQLAEVIARALSPGINDPFTAMTCLDWMKCVLDVYLRSDGRAGKLQATSRIRIRPIDFDQIMASCFDQTQQYIASDRNVALHTMKILAELAPVSPDPDRRKRIIAQMQKLATACDSALDPHSSADEIQQRFTDAQALITDPDLAYKARDSRNWFGGSA